MFKNLFGKNADGSAQTKNGSTGFAPGTEIAYHPDLIKRFLGHHVSLQKLFGSVKAHAVKDEFMETRKSLQSFQQALTTHLLEENVKLYTYLSKCLVNDPENRELMLAMKSEMGKIGTAVMRFVSGYVDTGITSTNKQQFLKELDDIGATLVNRIEREESSLYTMYMPPGSFT